MENCPKKNFCFRKGVFFWGGISNNNIIYAKAKLPNIQIKFLILKFNFGTWFFLILKFSAGSNGYKKINKLILFNCSLDSVVVCLLACLSLKFIL